MNRQVGYALMHGRVVRCGEVNGMMRPIQFQCDYLL